ncbi:unnamed protein product [Pseudo-nitzschia multistriata]|uniref:Uncharacterized protein n=1 Tax=Pseudo-nitzschia multistriata TaxID=183589 RepID=A0A448ZB00_9STRA|nr:unnamed protein product [Pseudo-nitzschia multistriata]
MLSPITSLKSSKNRMFHPAFSLKGLKKSFSRSSVPMYTVLPEGISDFELATISSASSRVFLYWNFERSAKNSLSRSLVEASTGVGLLTNSSKAFLETNFPSFSSTTSSIIVCSSSISFWSVDFGKAAMHFSGSQSGLREMDRSHGLSTLLMPLVSPSHAVFLLLGG